MLKESDYNLQKSLKSSDAFKRFRYMNYTVDRYWFKSFRKLIFFAFILALSEGLIVLAINEFFQLFLNNSIPSKLISTVSDYIGFTSDINFLVFCNLILIVAVTGCLRLRMLWLQNHFIERHRSKTVIWILQRFLSLDYSEIHMIDKKDFERNIISEVDVVVGYTRATLLMIVNSLMFLLILISLLLVNTAVTIIALGALVGLFTIFSLVVRSAIHKQANHRINGNTNRFQVLEDILKNYKSIKIHKSENHFMENYIVDECEYTDGKFKGTFLTSLPPIASEVVALIIFSSCIFYAERSGISIDLGNGLAIAYGLLRVISPLKLMSQMYGKMNNSIPSLLNLSDFVTSFKYLEENSKTKIDYLANKSITDQDRIAKIKIQNVSFGFEPASNIIENKSLVLEAGQIYMLTGRSGSGKTSLVDMIAGLLTPTEGTVSFQTYEGVVVGTNQFSVFGSYATQFPELYTADLLYNVTLDADPNPDNMKRSLRILSELGLKHLVDRFSCTADNYRSRYGALSGGEKQRLGLARVIFKDSSVIIFDEPTSSLDDQSKLAFVQFLDKIRSDKIVVIITHDEYLLSRYENKIPFVSKTM